MGLVLVTEGGSHQIETYIPSQQCVEANGAGGAGVQLWEVDEQECGWVGVHKPTQPASHLVPENS